MHRQHTPYFLSNGWLFDAPLELHAEPNDAGMALEKGIATFYHTVVGHAEVRRSKYFIFIGDKRKGPFSFPLFNLQKWAQ